MKKHIEKQIGVIGTIVWTVIVMAVTGETVYGMSVDGESAVFESAISFTQPAAGRWFTENGHWKYLDGNGAVRNRWICIAGTDGRKDWYCFDADGNMCTGWQKSGSGNWYYLRETPDSRMGAMEHGFLLEPADGRMYYLDPDSGIMRTGWVTVDGNDYYFACGQEGASSWYWDVQSQKWSYNGNGSRPYGSMYANERTPDGRFADSTGVCAYKEGGQ